MESKIKLLIVDDHQVVRKGLILLFKGNKEIDVVAEASDGNSALEVLKTANVDVLISDITMPGMDGIALAKKVTEDYPRVKTLILTMHLDEDYVVEAFNSGVKGYLTKDVEETEIIEAVKSVYAGNVQMNKSVSEILAKSLINNRKHENKRKEINLTKREKEALKYIIEGYTNKEIASKWFLSEKTVNVHRYNLMKKVGAKNTADLVRLSFEFRLA